eukprot:1192113-Prorocentrum_minimum.AAC.1
MSSPMVISHTKLGCAIHARSSLKPSASIMPRSWIPKAFAPRRLRVRHQRSTLFCSASGETTNNTADTNEKPRGVFDALFEHDPNLKNYEAHLQYRWNQYSERKGAIEKAEGSLLEFSKGYVTEPLEYDYAKITKGMRCTSICCDVGPAGVRCKLALFGITKGKDGSIIYREWLPAASSVALFGDFNEWNDGSHKAERKEFGVWELTLPPGTIPHNSRLVTRLDTDIKPLLSHSTTG